MRAQRRILICGAGSLGRALAEGLARDGHLVTVVDHDPDRLAGLEAVADLRTVTGSATSLRTLGGAGAAEADVVLAVTASDSANTLICGLARRLGAAHAIARVRDGELAEAASAIGLSHLGIDRVISPEALAVEAVVRIIATPGASDAVDLAGGTVAVRALLVAKDGALAGATVAEARQRVPGDWLIAAVEAEGGWKVAGPGDRLAAGSRAYVCCPKSEVRRLVHAFDPAARPARSVLVIGSGAAAAQLARRLAVEGLETAILAGRGAPAERLAAELDPLGVEVLAGTMQDADLLLRRAHAADVVAAAADDDEDNLMAALLVRARGLARVVVVANHGATVRLLHGLDLDALVSPRLLAASALLRLVRGRGVGDILRLSDERLDLIEVVVAHGSRAVRNPLRDLGLPRGSLALAVARDGEVGLPRPDLPFQPGDRVVLIADHAHEAKALALFEPAWS
jgi:trk system potassium uptake protein TrkA